MAFDSGDVGQLIWGFSCLIGFSFLMLYDGYYKQNINIITRIYSLYLLFQTIGAMITIINSFSNSTFLSYFYVILLSLAACVYAVLAIILTFIPLKYDIIKLIKYGLTSIYLCFIIILIIIPPSQKMVALFCLYLPSASFAYISICLLFYWQRKNKYIFNKYIDDVDENSKQSTLLILGLIAGTIGMIDFIYPAFGFIGLVPNDYATLWTRTCDAIFYVPLIIPLIRYLDKMECFSLKNITKDETIIIAMDNPYDNELND